MTYRETEHLRVLIANERKDRLALVAPIVAALGHEVIAREIEVEDVGAVTARERPDVALVGLGESSDHALGLIERIVREAACPVITLIHAPDPGFVKEASKRGVFAYITDADAKDWQRPGELRRRSLRREAITLIPPGTRRSGHAITSRRRRWSSSSVGVSSAASEAA
jgi:DNA-binding NtrC family response regulator